MESGTTHHVVDPSGSGVTATASESKNNRCSMDEHPRPHRQRSLREIIGDSTLAATAAAELPSGTKTRQQEQRSSSGSFMNVLLGDDIDSEILRRRSSRISSLQDSDSDPVDPSLVFSKLKPTQVQDSSPGEASSVDSDELRQWIERFRDFIFKEATNASEGEKCMELLFQVHPELVKYRHASLSNDQSNDFKKRRRVGLKPGSFLEQGPLDVHSEQQRFFTLMTDWLQKLKIYVQKQPMPRHTVLWEKARLCFVYKTLLNVLRELELLPCEHEINQEAPEHFTSGVSFVRRSESLQENVSEIYEVLPPVIIQPPNLQIVKSEFTQHSIESIKNSQVLMVRMPNKDDTAVKNYLLEESLRQEMVSSSNGASCSLIDGLESISEMINDRTFLCCHYYLDQGGGGSIEPCTGVRGIDQSNIQVVIIVRKGIGGTCTLKNSARTLNDLRILPILMGIKSLPEVTFSEDLVCASSLPVVSNNKRRVVNSTTPRKINLPRSFQFCKEVPVKSRRNPQDPSLPQIVVKGTTNDWLDSLNTTATQIISSMFESKSQEGSSDSIKKSPSIMTSTSKRPRSTRCGNGSNPLSKSVKLHTLSCRLEMFVKESLWQSLPKTKQHELNSIVIGLEQWLLERIQIWNKDRMAQYCTEVISVIQTNMDDLEKETPKFRNKHILRGQNERDKTLLQDEKVNGLFQLLKGGTPPDHEVGVEVFGDIPEVPEFCSNFSFNTVKTTVVASGMYRPGLPEIPWPFYLITTRDCFTYDLIQVKSKITSKGRDFIKTDFYFHPDAVPEDYRYSSNYMDWSLCNGKGQLNEETSEEVSGFLMVPPEGAMPVGVTTYTSLFTSKELNEVERKADEVHEDAQMGLYPPECFHPTIGRSGGLKRTKYFFGARYLWTKDQLADPNAQVACGVRVDVPTNPTWMKDLIEDPLVHGGIVPQGFINSWALNMYHDGSEGIQSHFDDSSRFCQPIYSLRLFSDSRLSFGTQLYGFTNGAFFVPMPRGCITIMHDKSYAANVVKHCVRPCDMTGKSAGLIMRKINTKAWNEAIAYHLQETTEWFNQMHLDEDYTSHSVASATPVKNKSTKHKGAGLNEHNSRLDVQIQGEVQGVMQNLLKGVTRNINQEALNVGKLIKLENKEIRNVMSSMIKSLEAAEKQQIKDQKQRYQEMTQVESVMESVLKRIERNFYTPRKRKDQTPNYTTPKSKRSKAQMENNKNPLSNESVILAATQIIEKVMGRGNLHLMQTACNLLKKFGSAWLKGDRGGLEQVFLNQGEPGQLLPTNRGGLSMDPMPLESLQSGPEVISPVLVHDQYFPTRPITRSLYHGLTKKSSSLDNNSMAFLPLKLEEFVNCSAKEPPNLDSKSEEGEEESKKILNELVEAVLKKVVPSNSKTVLCTPTLRLSEDLLKQISQETDMLDFGLWSDTSSPSVKTESSKRTYKLVPWGLCFDCEKQGFDAALDVEVEGGLWQCQGPCRRSFHHHCRPQFADHRCNDCVKGTHRCHACGEGATNALGAVLKCSLGVCGRYYHIPCVMSIPATTVLDGNWMPVGSVTRDKSCMKFRCPQHYCKTCGLSGANIYSVMCIRCPAAFHARCKPAGCVQLSKKLIVCPEHIQKTSELLR